MKSPSPPDHPGRRIREEVIPKGVSITKAAELMGVSRPSLSKLINGKAGLSTDMAARLEAAFGFPLTKLMEMQAKSDLAEAGRQAPSINTRPHVPPFLAIKASNLDYWASNNISARSRFPVLLRTLVHSTGNRLTSVDFPGNDDAERPGWDGQIEAPLGTPWIPSGKSGWELGCGADPKRKAEHDFQSRTRSIDSDLRREMTFVFVTPHKWKDAQGWAASKREQSLWRDVRALDSSSLEQWLELSLPAQVWFANEMQLPSQQVRSLERCWSDWSNTSIPPLSGTLFRPAIEASKRIMRDRLLSQPNGPTLIVADSSEEALAFLAQFFNDSGDQELEALRHRTLVFGQPDVLPKLAAAAQTFVPVVFTREVERELAVHASSRHSIVIYPRNALTVAPHIVLEPVNHEIFRMALAEMGKNRDEIAQLERASGRSLTVLRRQLSSVPALRTPVWASEERRVSSLMPFLFVGAWNSQNETDKTALSLLADMPYDQLEKDCQHFVTLNDAPVWSIGSFRGVVSKIDLLYAIAGSVTQHDLKRYFQIARVVLGEDDPALDLPEDQRWAAALHGKTREFSSAFRAGVSETLVLLAVNGGPLFKARLGIDPESEVARLIRELLPAPLTTRALAASDRDLPTYAEAAPDVFLTILEQDLRQSNPSVLGLLRPVDASVFGQGPSRTGLLWALEGLAWSPTTLPRVAFILAQLARVTINDNWLNKPFHSLESIFRAWMPQTAASVDQRLELMKKLAAKFPDVAWRLCLEQFGSHNHTGHYSHKPRWRTDEYGFGEPLPTWGPIRTFVREMVEMALSWSGGHTASMLADLVARLHALAPDDQSRVWALIQGWAEQCANDEDKAMLREKIRTTTLSRRAAIRAQKNPNGTNLAVAGRAACNALAPQDLVLRHAWLFQEVWLQESADELHEENIDHEQRQARVDGLRLDALRELLTQRGVDGLLQLAERGKASWVIGRIASTAILTEEELRRLLRAALASLSNQAGDEHPLGQLISGAMSHLVHEVKYGPLLSRLTVELSNEDLARLFSLAPFGSHTWQWVEQLPPEARTKYWNRVRPYRAYGADESLGEGIMRLLDAGRPRAAFACVQYDVERYDAELIFRLLLDMAQSNGESPGEYVPAAHPVEDAFKYLDRSSAISLEQKAALELAYINVLSSGLEDADDHGIPNLEKYLEQHPDLFVQAVVWTFRRQDGAQDPDEFRVPEENAKSMAERGYRLLDAIRRIPGQDETAPEQAARLARWFAAVRGSCSDLGRRDIADDRLGKLLSHAPVGSDGIWPCGPVRDLVEDLQSEPMAEGMCVGVYNSRGVHMAGEGGAQERAIAQKYLNWARKVEVSHPFLASKVLGAIAQYYEHDAKREDIAAGVRRRLH